jgi:hypothetical protein
VSALIVANNLLERVLGEVYAKASRGFLRGRRVPEDQGFAFRRRMNDGRLRLPACSTRGYTVRIRSCKYHKPREGLSTPSPTFIPN